MSSWAISTTPSKATAHTICGIINCSIAGDATRYMKCIETDRCILVSHECQEHVNPMVYHIVVVPTSDHKLAVMIHGLMATDSESFIKRTPLGKRWNVRQQQAAIHKVQHTLAQQNTPMDTVERLDAIIMAVA